MSIPNLQNIQNKLFPIINKEMPRYMGQTNFVSKYIPEIFVGVSQGAIGGDLDNTAFNLKNMYGGTSLGDLNIFNEYPKHEARVFKMEPEEYYIGIDINRIEEINELYARDEKKAGEEILNYIAQKLVSRLGLLRERNLAAKVTDASLYGSTNTVDLTAKPISTWTEADIDNFFSSFIDLAKYLNYAVGGNLFNDKMELQDNGQKLYIVIPIDVYIKLQGLFRLFSNYISMIGNDANGKYKAFRPDIFNAVTSGITGGIAAGISAMNGTLQTNTRAKNTGLNFGEANALEFAGKMTGIGEDTLISSIESLQTSLKDYSKWGDLASLGLNAQDLEKKNPTEALFEVLESMKDSGLPQHLKKQIIDNLGIPFDQFQFVLKEGTGEMQKYFKEGMGMFGGKSGKSLMAGERALIRFTAILKDVSQNIGGKIAPALTTGLKLITPYIYKLADGFTWLLGKVINKRNLNIISGLFNSIGKIGGDLISKGMDIFSGGKDLFKNMFAGFSVDTGGWSSILKELGGGFLDGISKLWDTLKPNLIAIGQSLVDVWAMIEPDLLAFLKFWKENILPPLQSIAGSAINILGKVLKRVIADFKWFYQLVRPYFKYIGNIVSKWYNTLAGIFKMFDTGTDEEGGVIGGLASLLSPISNLKLAFDLIKTAVDFARDSLNTFKTKITETWENVKNSWSRILLVIDRAVHRFTDAIMGFNLFGKTIAEHFGGTYKPKYKSMNGWEQVLDKDGTYKWLSKNGGTAQYPEVRADNINDGVITKEGKIIKTDPQDYIFAMKRPQDLAAAGTSQGGTYTININANVRHDNDVKQIRNELERLIRNFNSKR